MTFERALFATRRCSRWQSTLIVGALLIFALLADVALGYVLGATFYIAPVVCAAWLLGVNAGLCVTVLVLLLEAVTSRLGLTAPLVVCEAFRLGILSVLLGKLRFYVDRTSALATTDPLTGVLNVRSFGEAIERELERMRRSTEFRPMAVAFVDVDDFKRVNDEHGHRTGDVVLRHVAQAFVSNLRRIDVVGRLGGDEFAVLMPDTSPSAARQAVDRAVLLLRATAPVRVTISVGLSSFASAPLSAEDVLRGADEAMYRAKRTGKARVVAADMHAFETTGEFALSP